MRLITLVRHAYRRVVPAKRDPFEITPDQLEVICDQAMEDHTGRPQNRGDAQANLEAMERRLAVQQEDWKFMATCPATDTDPEWVAGQMARMREQIEQTKALIEGYQAMLKAHN